MMFFLSKKVGRRTITKHGYAVDALDGTMKDNRPFADDANRKIYLPWTLPGYVPLTKRAEIEEKGSK